MTGSENFSGPVLEDPETFSAPEKQKQNLKPHECCYSHILDMKRVSHHTKTVRHLHPSVPDTDELKNGFAVPKIPPAFEKR